ncbi:MAG: glutamine--fructose-6-phosphate transaminase (isomerizing) [Legionellales bacterium]|nr:glutamine--fructose-6-phosphate transaminase (isomerizing) [Legionellales bacterium]
MCGIVGAIAKRNVAEILVAGLKRLEYRGYDSAGIAILNKDSQTIHRIRKCGKVSELTQALQQQMLPGDLGIAHTRWATHGEPAECNAHPHVSQDDFALVHNGIIENFTQLKQRVIELGYTLHSQTDSELIVHLIHHHYQQTGDEMQAITRTTEELQGAYALGVISRHHPDRLFAVRQGSPLVIGLGIEENFIASDQLALLPVTHKFIFLEEGDQAQIALTKVAIFDKSGRPVTRDIVTSDLSEETVQKGPYRHYMQKEIFEQPKVLAETLGGRISGDHILLETFGEQATKVLPQIEHIQIIACGTSYHAGLVAKYWLEDLAGIACQVETASEFRYRPTVIQPNTLLVCISQSGETADTLAALRKAQQLPYLATLAICNVPTSSLVREADLVLMTRAGTEIGVASTKAFTAQLTALLMLTLALNQEDPRSAAIVQQLVKLPAQLTQVLDLDDHIQHLATWFADKTNALFLGRGIHYPIALEGALKLKEISYIHAEAYPAGELKHGPLALVDNQMPVITIAPNDQLLEKLKSNLQEVRARGGQLLVFADHLAGFENEAGIIYIPLPTIDAVIAPIVYTVPLQLLAYHVAVIKGTDVDQPRNLAKSVTVE